MTDLPGAENVIPPAEAEVNPSTPPAEVPQPDNPAWSDFLGAIPASMHDMVKPHLRKWDDGVNQRITQVHSEWADFKPFKDAGLTPDVINQAYGIYQAINDDPQKVWQILGETYGYANQPQVNPTPAQGQGQPNPQAPQINQPTGDEYDIGQGGQFNPELARMQAMTDNMAKILIAQENQRREAAEDAALETELSAARQKFGNFDERFVLNYVNAGSSMEDAIKAYNSLVNGARSDANRPQAPVTLGGAGTGNLPSQQIDPAKLNGAETRKLVAEMFKANNQQG